MNAPDTNPPKKIQQRFINEHNIPLILAGFLAYDDYDYDPTAISATTLLKPLRQLILKERVNTEGTYLDVASMVKNRLGSAIHNGVEKVWLEHHELIMQLMGYPENIISRIRINPDPAQLTDECIPIYFEKRMKRKITVQGTEYTISGKPDIIANGAVQDVKTTSVITHNLSDKDEDYIMQCSIYRWLNPEIITKPELQINFLFTDWFPGRAKADANYPQSACTKHPLPLLSLEETERYIVQKLITLQELKNAPEEMIPFCNDRELWRKASEFKWWSKAESMAEGKRCSKNFKQDQDAAKARVAEKGGVIREIPGSVKACCYCPAFDACSQKDQYLREGTLIVD